MTPEHRLNLIISILSRGAERLAASSQLNISQNTGCGQQMPIEAEQCNSLQKDEIDVRSLAPHGYPRSRAERKLRGPQ